ncbi:MAG: hypothetical protein WAW75_09850 [Gallionella sp.]
MPRISRRNHAHQLLVVGEQQRRGLLSEAKLLSIEFLTEWLVARVGMPYTLIDPLKLNCGRNYQDCSATGIIQPT